MSTIRTMEQMWKMLPEMTETGPIKPLELWQLALVLEMVQCGALASPCLALALAGNCGHDEAHAAIEILFDKLGLSQEERESCRETIH